MKIHREGFAILTGTAVILFIINAIVIYLSKANAYVVGTSVGISFIVFILFLQFFRLPLRNQTLGDNLVVAPADGKIVVIEEAEENEYYKEKRKMISIFMSPFNVHCNWYPVSGKITYVRYHEGKYLVAWHPKASTDNERTTIVIEKDSRISVLVRQIAGAVAKRIVYYPHENDKVLQGAELGFIKFGSRVDVFLPLSAKVNVTLGQVTKGGVTIIAELV
jgi:phosphatidylserine decarboxylase